MLHGEHSAILSPFIKLPFAIKVFVLSIFEWPFYTGFTVYYSMSLYIVVLYSHGLIIISLLEYELIYVWLYIQGVNINVNVRHRT